MINQLVFMRTDRNRKRGQIAGHPFAQNQNIGSDKYFITVDIDLTDVDISVIEDVTSIELILPPLLAKYKDVEEQYEDENGDMQSRTIYGYFSELGNNSGETPMITLNDLTWEGK